MQINYPEVPVDANGLATEQHIADHHVGTHGELTLCGVYIDYNTWKGTAPGAPRCDTCEGRDG
jgi:predicted transcriptional regulator